MATKFLARTVVEGGRSGYSKWERRHNNRVYRRCWRLDDDGEVIVRRPAHSYRGFADRLVPLYRWLDSRCGLPWAKVYAEFCRENDWRTMKGWHLHEHLSSNVYGAGFRETGAWRRSRYDYEIEGGILRKAEPTYPWNLTVPSLNAVQKENKAARRRARRRNGSR